MDRTDYDLWGHMCMSWSYDEVAFGPVPMDS